MFMALTELPKETTTKKSYENKNRDITFIGTHHLGKEKYYNELKREIIDYKSQGYVVYYEILKTPTGLDSLTLDSVNRKLRRIVGFMPSVDFYDSVTEGTFLENLVPQPVRYC